MDERSNTPAVSLVSDATRGIDREESGYSTIDAEAVPRLRSSAAKPSQAEQKAKEPKSAQNARQEIQASNELIPSVRTHPTRRPNHGTDCSGAQRPPGSESCVRVLHMAHTYVSYCSIFQLPWAIPQGTKWPFLTEILSVCRVCFLWSYRSECGFVMSMSDGRTPLDSPRADALNGQMQEAAPLRSCSPSVGAMKAERRSYFFIYGKTPLDSP